MEIGNVITIEEIIDGTFFRLLRHSQPVTDGRIGHVGHMGDVDALFRKIIADELAEIIL